MGNLLSRAKRMFGTPSVPEPRTRRPRQRGPPPMPAVIKVPRGPTDNGSSFSTKRPPQVYRYGCPPAPPSTPIGAFKEMSMTMTITIPEAGAHFTSLGEGAMPMIVEEDPAPPLVTDSKETEVICSITAGAIVADTKEQFPSSSPTAKSTETTPLTTPVKSAGKTTCSQEPGIRPISQSDSSITRLSVTSEIITENENAPEKEETATETKHKMSIDPAPAPASTVDLDIIFEPYTPELPPMRRIESYLSLVSSVSTFAEERQQKWTLRELSQISRR